MITSHAKAIDAVRMASRDLFASDLTEDQQQLVVFMMNAAQDLNTLYWEQVYANTAGGMTHAQLARLAWEASACEREVASNIASHIIANKAKV